MLRDAIVREREARRFSFRGGDVALRIPVLNRKELCLACAGGQR